MQEREEIQKKLAEAQINAEKSIEELKVRKFEIYFFQIYFLLQSSLVNYLLT